MNYFDYYKHIESLLDTVISTEGEEIFVYEGNEPLLKMLFPRYTPYEEIPKNSIRFKKNYDKYNFVKQFGVDIR